MTYGQFRGKNWGFFVFFVILILHCVAILLFTSGFLLTRTELSHFSQCSDVSDSPCSARSSSEDLSNLSPTILNPGCWTKPAVDRVVIIVLDALRFDFVAPSTFFTEKKPWMDKLKILHKLSSQHGSSARIFKAIADPPTTSLQRLKGLTTGGLPTFIDVGNSFGAPAIVEDNLIYQLAKSGKRVVMMGDDTWLQLFPQHFNKSYPFPSFNVKDLDTVDNGCIEHLFPSLYEEDWDVLIAHFLGVDHAGHIFGVDSSPMVDKLEQYNSILEKVVEVLESKSGPGGLHENTLLLVMGDHGQTINGDHGGGNPEEVETSVFAMSMKKPPQPSEFDDTSCRLDLEGRKVCVSYMEQLDFAVTVSALLGLPFPYGSIGRVNPTLYGLVAGTWNLDSFNPTDNCNSQSLSNKWMQNYVNVLCVNSWQVKKYIDVYSSSSVIGFSKEDLLHVEQTYAQAMNNSALFQNGKSCDKSSSALRKQIDSYSKFLASVAELARTKWTEFNLTMMGFGLGVMLISIVIHILEIKELDKLCGISFPSVGNSKISLKMVYACAFVMIRACSFLSNSFILEEGKVASFLLASLGMLYLRYSTTGNTKVTEAITFVFLISAIRFAIELGLSKQGVDSILKESETWTIIAEIMPILALLILSYTLYKITIKISYKGLYTYIIGGSILSYMLIAVHWALESNLLNLKFSGGNYIPQTIYTVGFAQLSVLVLDRLFNRKKSSDWEGILAVQIFAMVSSWSSTVIVLSGKQGPFVALASALGGWLIMRLNKVEMKGNKGILDLYSSSVTQWSLFATCLFFCTGHWCAFDGLRYAAAFIGFDEFNLVRQAILLSIETFGFSHIIPIFGLPLLIFRQYPSIQSDKRKQLIYMQLSQVYLIYGLIMAITVSFTILCVTIQRRHLMVWGLFAPKFVFDVVGLLLSDVFICFASFFYLR